MSGHAEPLHGGTGQLRACSLGCEPVCTPWCFLALTPRVLSSPVSCLVCLLEPSDALPHTARRGLLLPLAQGRTWLRPRVYCLWLLRPVSGLRAGAGGKGTSGTSASLAGW